MISEASDVNRKNQKLLSKEKVELGEEEEEGKEEGEGGFRRSLSSMFKKKKERARPVSFADYNMWQQLHRVSDKDACSNADCH